MLWLLFVVRILHLLVPLATEDPVQNWSPVLLASLITQIAARIVIVAVAASVSACL